MTGAQRYTDLDLQIDPSLIVFAIEYAKGYIGDWDVMRSARDRVLQEGSLPVSVARLVLNCARTDPRVNQDALPAGRAGTFTGAFPPDLPPGTYEVTGLFDDPPSVRVAPKPSERPQRRLRVVPDEPEELYREFATGRWVPWRGRFDLKTTWHWRYGMSTHKAARVWHVLDPAKSRIEYYPVQPGDHRNKQFDVRIVWVCASEWRGTDQVRLCATPPEGLMCATCQRILESDEYADVGARATIRQWWQGELKRWDE